MKPIAWVKIVAVAAILTMANVGASDTANANDIRMDLVTCQPEGVRGSLQAGYDPLAYWIEQAIALERALESYAIERPDSDCPSRAKNRIELEECRGYTRNYVQAAQKCLVFSRRMVALHRAQQ
jgi:hypothetical protein